MKTTVLAMAMALAAALACGCEPTKSEAPSAVSAAPHDATVITDYKSVTAESYMMTNGPVPEGSLIRPMTGGAVSAPAPAPIAAPAPAPAPAKGKGKGKGKAGAAAN
jgi:hypothetical protein